MWRFKLGSHCAAAALVALPALARADGGTLLLSQVQGGYRISLFTSPAPLRAGPVDFSVLVQSADSGATVGDVPVTVEVYPESQPHRRSGGPATGAAATNKLFQAIQLELPTPGRWQVELTVGAPNQVVRASTTIELGPPIPSWLDLSLWIGWPLAAIMLFVAHQCLVRRAGRRAARTPPRT